MEVARPQTVAGGRGLTQGPGPARRNAGNMENRTIVDRPGYIRAALIPRDETRAVVAVSHSVIVGAEDPVYRPVRELLSTHCHGLIDIFETADPDFMFRRSVTTLWQLWVRCPRDRHHACIGETAPETAA